MVVEIINTGTELMLGRTLNTHQQWLCRRLADMGLIVSRQVAIADTAHGIENTVRESLSRADLVITTGGLGPTSDDVTRDLIASMLGLSLKEDPAIVERIASFFKSRGRPMPERTRLQARVPEGALVLPNHYGTAPGLAIRVQPNPFRAEAKPAWLIMLPGPPRELRPMFDNQLVPLLQKEMLPPAAFVCHTLRTVGVGESVVEERIAQPLQHLVDHGLEIGYCARPGRVDVRLASNAPEAATLVAEAEQIVREKVGLYVYGVEDEELEQVVIRRLLERKETISLAESCTGGLIAHLLTNVPGSSGAFMAGLVTYSNEAKQQFLGVRAETLRTHGAVSEETVREMAQGVRQACRTTYSLAVTGIAGPGGGTPEKPVGTVFIGLAAPSGVKTLKQLNATDRETFKQLTAQQALSLLFGALK